MPSKEMQIALFADAYISLFNLTVKLADYNEKNRLLTKWRVVAKETFDLADYERLEKAIIERIERGN